MAAYIVVNIRRITDAAAFEEYRAKVPPVIRKHGGEYLVRGGQFNIAEGDWKPGRIVILRFADMATAQGFYNDPEYEPLKQLRQRASDADLVFVEGV